ncbi:hypothetical protein TraAM80_04971 [Trypanosoma rangeli]|uniref:Uncharacterized protein n=1 Tax=Trypanosoma rangeli TaxID=5698 RepID=A0A3R7KMU3_TRYRA|nr:uncharacterized protein TraAM80_04971 [Trypanosoma rangeli]RNF04839.1 hypothetical protein TraAM80_04971 [Trypanosoma rangeli]|eukprot:RNF04839.1 hypothetical protein TraAM80_04971 [Trypanosoma rangeli]
MRHTRKHFRVEGGDDLPAVDMEQEVRDATSRNDVCTILPLTSEGVKLLSRFYPPVKNAADMDTLAKRLSRMGSHNEFGFSPLFSPLLVDAACQRGIFPMSILVDADHYLFAPKLHHERCVTQLQPPVKGFPMSSDDKEGKFVVEMLHVSKKYLLGRNESTRTRSFDVFINRNEDIVPALSLIVAQHGENWMCRALRACLIHMFFNKDSYRTKIVVVAVCRHRYPSDPGENATNSNEQVCNFAEGDAVNEGDLISTEVGFIVGDIYCSMTGAYSSSGSGTLQLAVTGEALRTAGCSVWDLGMDMMYKRKMLNCVSLPRKQWLEFVREHVADVSVAETIEGRLREQFSEGVAVRPLLLRT